MDGHQMDGHQMDGHQMGGHQMDGHQMDGPILSFRSAVLDFAQELYQQVALCSGLNERMAK